MNNKTIAILTPTYNRANTLNSLYQSLLNQSSFDFNWYIVDDGSTDDTESLCKSFISDNFTVSYVKKPNGGKHTALNEGLKHIEEPLTFIVDSDDFLKPFAIQTILDDWEIYKDDEKIAGLSYYRITKDDAVWGNQYTEESSVIVSSYIDLRINKAVNGDKAEVYRTNVLKQFPFPVFDGEKFLSEAVVRNRISHAGFNLAFIPKGIYVCDYIQGGLTKQGRLKQILSPRGTLEHAKVHLFKELKLSVKIKYMLMYIAIVKFAKLTYRSAFKELDGNKLLFILCFLPAQVLRLKWKKFKV